ncbi:tetratricopeptide repeat protein [Methylobacterium sp. Leaf118]|uniref:tetratricopeptide repeat protein n=1 Tax=Methylobacterium sp. Leaf118 TaxID=2876562 RepID=UPI001E61F759|nr:tetratricopeptide repeat protein [Methylobacterium sp. Leaf118]
MADLYRLLESRGPLETNVIFVHGLGGDPRWTWQATPDLAMLWPCWLAEDIEGLAVWSVGYEAPVSRWRGHALHLVDRAENILGRLLTRPELRDGRIVLIGHSLGGLVIKQLFRMLEREAAQQRNAAELLARIDKVAFLATPHLGSDLTEWGDWLRILVRPSAATMSLVRNDPNLRDLNNWYRDWATERGLHHLVLREGKPTRILGMIVKPDSADPALHRVRAWVVDEDHASIAKPRSRADEVYAYVLGFLREAVERPVSPVIEATNQILEGQSRIKGDTASILDRLDAARQGQAISVFLADDAVRIDSPGASVAAAEPDIPWRSLDEAVQPGDINLLDALRWNFGLARTLHGRDDDLRQILDWAEAKPSVPSARLITGEGGAGKTRLAATAAARLRERGWKAGFVRAGVPLRVALSGSRGLLLILDYPEESPDLTRSLIEALAATPRTERPIRFLLLSRRDFAHWDSAVVGLEGRFGRQPIAAPDALSAIQASALIREAAEAFAARAGRPVPNLERAASWLGETPLHRLPLFAVAAAVHAVLAPDMAFGIEGGAIIRDLAERERARVRRTSEQLGIGPATLERLLALGILADGLGGDVIDTLVAEGIAGERRADAIVPRIADTPWWRGGRLTRLQPDRVAACFLDTVLFDPRFPEGDRQLPDWLSAALVGAETGIGGRLGRILFDLDAPGVARGGAAPLERALVTMIEREPSRAARFVEFASGRVPFPAAGFAAVVAATLAGLVKQAPEQAASLLSNAGGYLSQIGRREEALAAAQEATGLYRDLARARPDAFTPDLAVSLNNLGNRLSELGRREEALAAAQESVEIWRALAHARPETFTPDLAMSLNNLGNRLSELGRREEALAAAQEAVEIRITLASARPDTLTPDLAVSLNNLGNRLSELGRREEALAVAREATGLYRDLARARPEVFTPDLAGSLNNLGNRLSELDCREEALAAAQEAVEIRHALARARPEAFMPDLALSLNNLGNRLSKLGRREEALTAAQDATGLCRDLAGVRPEAFTPDLALSLNNLGNRLSQLGRCEEALAAAQEAVAVFAELARARPDAFARNLLVSSNNLAAQLSELGRDEEAEAVRQRIRRLLEPGEEA